MHWSEQRILYKDREWVFYKYSDPDYYARISSHYGLPDPFEGIRARVQYHMLKGEGLILHTVEKCHVRNIWKNSPEDYLALEPSQLHELRFNYCGKIVWKIRFSR